MDKIYPAKLLLLGEHTILRGSRALAVPFPSKYCYWVCKPEVVDENLLQFANYLEKDHGTYFDLTRLQGDITAGWQLASTIPVGYGMGSSGAVCIAVFDRYATKYGEEAATANPKAFFATVENYFHGNSSGTDPLITYRQQAVCLYTDGRYQEVTLPNWPTKEWTFFLLDTRKARQTGPLVTYFVERYDTEASFRQQANEQWIPATEKGIDSWLAGNWEDLATAFSDISTFQLAQLPPMVLPELRHVWLKGLANQRFSLKICGAGGGGYCLGVTADWHVAQTLLADWPCEKLGNLD